MLIDLLCNLLLMFWFPHTSLVSIFLHKLLVLFILKFVDYILKLLNPWILLDRHVHFLPRTDIVID